jgi:hypothetical protein
MERFLAWRAPSGFPLDGAVLSVLSNVGERTYVLPS